MITVGSTIQFRSGSKMETKFQLSCDLAVAFKQKMAYFYNIRDDCNDGFTVNHSWQFW